MTQPKKPTELPIVPPPPPPAKWVRSRAAENQAAWVAVFDPTDGKYYVGMITNLNPVSYTLQRHLGDFDHLTIQDAVKEAHNRGR